MAKKSLDILLVFDVNFDPPSDQNYSKYYKLKDWKSEGDVYRSLKRLGHRVRTFGVFDDIYPLVKELRTSPPDLIFNMSEAFDSEREHEPNIASLFELMGVSFTGATPTALRLCKDKALTKKILSYHNLRVPKFRVVKKGQSVVKNIKSFDFPVLVKPLGLEASEGISLGSFVNTEKNCAKRVKYIHDKYDTDVILEEYIDGRELYVGIVGNKKLITFPPRELNFIDVPDHKPKIATYRSKWDDDYRWKWGIQNDPAFGLSKELRDEISEFCKKAYRALDLSGYARLDLRLTDEDEIVFLEANPNPCIAKIEDFSVSAKKYGLDYDQLIEKIVSLAV